MAGGDIYKIVYANFKTSQMTRGTIQKLNRLVWYSDEFECTVFGTPLHIKTVSKSVNVNM